MEFVKYLGIENVLIFALLFARFSGLFAFFPFFGHLKIPMSVKAAMVFLFTLILFPFASSIQIVPNALNLLFCFMSELMLGFMAGLVLYLVFGMLELAGEQISFVMGFTMANVMDPQTGKNSPLLAQFFTLIALTLFLLFDGHHLLILLYYKSLQAVPLGSFYPQVSMWEFISKGMLNLFIFGFILSFPIKAMSFLADVIFGMLMKTMPQFNLLVVGFPIKIMISFAVLIATLGAMFSVFKTQILQVIEGLALVFLHG